MESWNIAGWTTSILLHKRFAGKHRNFKQNRQLNSPRLIYLSIRQHVKIEDPVEFFFVKYYVGELCYNLLTRSSFGYQDNGLSMKIARPKHILS